MDLEPIGELRADWRTAYLMAGIFNIVREQGQEPFKPIDVASPWLREWYESLGALEAGQVQKNAHVSAFEELYAYHQENG